MEQPIISDPAMLKRCTRCVMPETQEAVTFDEAGVCSTCRQIEFKHEKIDWPAREKEFLALCDEYRGKNQYDCIVPFSGGKDSTFTAYKLARDYGLKPLVVQYHHQLLRPKVLANAERAVKRLGVDFLSFKTNWQLIKKLMRVGLERKGDILWYQHTAIFALPMHIAIRFKVPLIIWGEPSAEYTSYFGYEETEEVDEKRFNMWTNLGITAEDMLGFLDKASVSMRDLWPYQYPPRADLNSLQCRSVCLGSYLPWDVKKNSQIISEELGWQGDEVEGVPPEYYYEKIEDMMQGVQDYLKFIKRGYGRMSHLASIDIRNGRMTRDQALSLIAEWEGLRPMSLDVLLGWLKITENEFYQLANLHAVSPWRHDSTKTRRGQELGDQKLWNKD